MTTILDAARLIEHATGKAPLTPRWEATARAFYGLELRESDLDHLAAATRRTKSAWRALAAERGLNRRAYRELWARVGRRGRKSFTMALLAVFEAAFGGHERYLVDGEQGLIAVISKDTAGSTLVARFCEIHAQALGLETRWTSIGAIKVLEIVGVVFGIACFPCNAKAPRGFAIPVIIADEIALWNTDDASATADDEVIGGIKPAMAQFPDSKLLGISSAFGKDGRHYETIEANLGDSTDSELHDPDTLAVEGPTWDWNPGVTEARTHEIEKDPKRHSREYGAECGDTVSAALDSADHEGCYGRTHAGLLRGGFLSIDASSLRGDSFAWIAGRETDRGEVVVLEADGFEGEQLRSVTMSDVVERIVSRARAWNVGTVIGDQREQASLTSMFAERGMGFLPIDWSIQSKEEAFQALRRIMRERRLLLPDHPRLRSELRSVKAKLLPSGSTRYETGGKDFASALVTLAHKFATNEIGAGGAEPDLAVGGTCGRGWRT